MTSTLFTAKTFDFNELQLSPAKISKNSKHGIQYRYYQLKNSRNKTMMQSPRLPTPFGLKYNEPMEGSTGPGNWSITIKFPNLDSKKYMEDDVIEFAKETDQKEIDFFMFCHKFDAFTKGELEKPAPGARKSKNAPTKTYKPFIKVTEKKENGSYTGEYHPAQVNLRVSSFNGLRLKAFNKDTSEISNGLDSNGKSIITPHSEVIVVFSLGRVYIQSDKYGPHCFADRVQFWPEAQSDDMDFIDEESGEIENIAKAVEKTEENLDDMEDGEVEFYDE